MKTCFRLIFVCVIISQALALGCDYEGPYDYEHYPHEHLVNSKLGKNHIHYHLGNGNLVHTDVSHGHICQKTSVQEHLQEVQPNIHNTIVTNIQGLHLSNQSVGGAYNVQRVPLTSQSIGVGCINTQGMSLAGQSTGNGSANIIVKTPKILPVHHHIKIIQEIRKPRVIIRHRTITKKVFITPKPIVRIKNHVNVVHIKKKPKIILHHKTVNKYIVHKPEPVIKFKTHYKTIHIHKKANEHIKHRFIKKYIIEKADPIYKTKMHNIDIKVEGKPVKNTQERFIRKYIVHNPNENIVDGQITDDLTGKIVTGENSAVHATAIIAPRTTPNGCQVPSVTVINNQVPSPSAAIITNQVPSTTVIGCQVPNTETTGYQTALIHSHRVSLTHGIIGCRCQTSVNSYPVQQTQAHLGNYAIQSYVPEVQRIRSISGCRSSGCSASQQSALVDLEN